MSELATLQKEYEAIKAQGLSLNMTRGKPSPEQLDLSNEMLTIVNGDDFKGPDGTDCRNYGGLDGLPEMKHFFADFFGVAASEVIIGGNASLNLMHNYVLRAMFFGVAGSEKPWRDHEKVTFLCPVPGYDRHFAVCADLGIEMVAVQMDDQGPNMDVVEKLVAEDASIRGMWCVPRYSNPNGVTYSDAVVDRLANMKTAADDFRILWDNAYNVHHLYDQADPLKNMLVACKAAGNADRVVMFGSTSKITFAGAGLAAIAASEANIADIKGHLSKETIGPDKLNQLRHIKFLTNMAGLEAHMRKHADILRPKFEMVDTILTKHFANSNLASWGKPRGGYFISLDTQPGRAKRVVQLAGDAGVALTPAGATFPHGKDPDDRNIRIAPSFPSLRELEQATEILCLCIKLASAE